MKLKSTDRTDQLLSLFKRIVSQFKRILKFRSFCHNKSSGISLSSRLRGHKTRFKLYNSVHNVQCKTGKLMEFDK